MLVLVSVLDLVAVNTDDKIVYSSEWPVNPVDYYTGWPLW